MNASATLAFSAARRDWSWMLRILTLGTPAHALVLARSTGHSNVYLVTVEEMMSTHPSVDGLDNPLVRAELVFL